MTHFCVAIDHLLVTTAAAASILVSTSQPIYQLILSSWVWINFADLECSLTQAEENVYLPTLGTPVDGVTIDGRRWWKMWNSLGLPPNICKHRGRKKKNKTRAEKVFPVGGKPQHVLRAALPWIWLTWLSTTQMGERCASLKWSSKLNLISR